MFVLSVPNWQLGLGKLVAQRGRVAKVEFFDHPGTDGRQLREFSVRDLRPHRLEAQTRVFVSTESGLWRAGRVDEVRDEIVDVQFSRHARQRVPADSVYVRWHQPIIDPIPFLEAFLSEPSELAALRRAFMREAVLQRSQAAGLEGLLSACVELEPHQMNVVRRVLTDPVQRYLLADEVGLGKTIEAAAIIRQHVIDDPQNHRIAVVVPETLVGQWRDELSKRFHLGPPFLDDSIRVVHPADDELTEALRGVRLVVVDEAHSIVGRHEAHAHSPRSTEVVREACRNAQSLLLLSATPAIADEDAFFELMQLIDPEIYPATEREAFRQRIANRQELAQIIAGFEPGALQFLEEDANRLVEMFPNDSRLEELINELLPIVREEHDSENATLVNAVQAVRQHLSETYRLHRRILRNRRKNAVGLTPTRIGAEVVEFADPTASIISRQLENWRLEVADEARGNSELSELHSSWARMRLESPHLLKDAIRRRLGTIRREGITEEVGILERLLQHLEAWSPFERRIQTLLDVVRKHGSPTCKLVVFSSSKDSADQCFEQLKARLNRAVVRHDPRFNEDTERPPEWARFVEDPACWVLVCDARAEVGLNLQGGRKALVHFDIPFSPNRIEQRLGRLDRFGSGDPIKSYVLCCADSDLESAWCRCLVDGFGVMNRSVASLQYLIESKMTALSQCLACDGNEAISSLTERLGGEQGEIQAELRRIDQQDELEALQASEPEAFDELLAVDGDWKRIRSAVEPWIQRGLHFIRQVQNDEQPGVDEIVSYRHRGPGEQGTVIPLARFRRDFLGAVDLDSRPSRSALPFTQRYAYRRQTAAKRLVHLMRTGDPLFAGLLDFAGADDRGRVTAVWRFCPRYATQTNSPDLFFRFDFLIEADLNPALELFPEAESTSPRRHALRRRMDLLLPPEYVTIWLDRALVEVNAEFVEKWLDGNAPRENGTQSDTDLDSTSWKKLRASGRSDAFLAWNDLVERASHAARETISATTERRRRSVDAEQRLVQESSAQLARLESRIASLSGRERRLEEGRLVFERLLTSALRKGIRAPLIQLDSVGVVFLSKQQMLA